MPEDNDYECPVCGKHFAEEEDYENHKDQDHPEVKEFYAEAFAKEDEYSDDLGDFTDKPTKGKYDDRPVVQGEPVGIVGEIEKQEDKPIQTHDDWKKELEGLKDEFATEQEKCAICNGEHPTSEHPVIEEGGVGSGPTGSYAPLPEQMGRVDIDPDYNPYSATPERERLQTDPELSRMTEDAPDESEDNLVWDNKTNHYVNKSEEQDDELTIDTDEDLYALHKGIMDKAEVPDRYKDDAEEEGGADAPLKKVDDLTESWKYMKREDKARLFETIGMTQGDAYALANLEWNYISKPLKKDVIRVYATEQEQDEEEKCEICDGAHKTENHDEVESNEVYAEFYNLEKNHSSSDFKKKKLTCNQCNESFKHINEYHIHYNEIHATEQEYTLPEECPYCHIEINEPNTLDWHMQEEHGAHVPSQFTQTGLQGAMADTDFDSLESHKKKAGEALDQQDKDHLELLKSGRIDGVHDPQREDAIKELESRESYAKEAKWECLDCDQEFDDAGKHLEDTGHHNIVRSHTESYAKERSPYWTNSFISPSQRVGNFESYWRCKICGADVDDSEIEQHYDEHDARGDIPTFESYAKEARLDSEGYPICQICGETITGDEDVLFDLTNNVKQHLLNHGKTEGEVAEIQHKMLMGGAMESRVSDLKRERKELANFINIASIENPLNIYNEQEKLREIDAELASLGESYAKEDHQVGEKWQATNPQGETYEYVNELDEDGVGTHITTVRFVGYDDPEGASEGEAGHQDLEDTTEYIGDDEEESKEAEMPEWFQDPEQREEAEKANAERVKQMQKAEEDDDERKCEGCGRMEDYLNDDDLCEDCEREAGIDRKESERDAYD